jgi:hypothetical protein
MEGFHRKLGRGKEGSTQSHRVTSCQYLDFKFLSSRTTNDLATLEKCCGLNPTLLQDNDFMKVWIQGHSINIPVSLENEICDIYIYIEN